MTRTDPTAIRAPDRYHSNARNQFPSFLRPGEEHGRNEKETYKHAKKPVLLLLPIKQERNGDMPSQLGRGKGRRVG